MKHKEAPSEIYRCVEGIYVQYHNDVFDSAEAIRLMKKCILKRKVR